MQSVFLLKLKSFVRIFYGNFTYAESFLYRIMTYFILYEAFNYFVLRTVFGSVDNPVGYFLLYNIGDFNSSLIVCYLLGRLFLQKFNLGLSLTLSALTTTTAFYLIEYPDYWDMPMALVGVIFYLCVYLFYDDYLGEE